MNSSTCSRTVKFYQQVGIHTTGCFGPFGPFEIRIKRLPQLVKVAKVMLEKYGYFSIKICDFCVVVTINL